MNNLNEIRKQKEQWYEMRKYASARIWELYYSAMEKQVLQMMGSNNLVLSDEEKTVLMYFDTKELNSSREEFCRTYKK